jgi:hypothetical protein
MLTHPESLLARGSFDGDAVRTKAAKIIMEAANFGSFDRPGQQFIEAFNFKNDIFNIVRIAEAVDEDCPAWRGWLRTEEGKAALEKDGLDVSTVELFEAFVGSRAQWAKATFERLGKCWATASDYSDGVGGNVPEEEAFDERGWDYRVRGLANDARFYEMEPPVVRNTLHAEQTLHVAMEEHRGREYGKPPTPGAGPAPFVGHAVHANQLRCGAFHFEEDGLHPRPLNPTRTYLHTHAHTRVALAGLCTGRCCSRRGPPPSNLVWACLESSPRTSSTSISAPMQQSCWRGRSQRGSCW